MSNSNVEKIIARYGKRECVASSLKEMRQFIQGKIRPEFDDKEVLCVKFIQHQKTDSVATSSWFINPAYMDGFAKHKSTVRLSPALCFSPTTASGPKMSAEFMPEILVIKQNFPKICMLKEFQYFHSQLGFLKNLSIPITLDEKLDLFLKCVDAATRGKTFNVVLGYYKMKSTNQPSN